MTEQAAVSVDTLKAIAAAFNAHDLDVIMEFFAEDCTLEMPRGPEPWGQRYTGKAAVREGLATRFKGLPDVHYSDDRHWVSGNSASRSGSSRERAPTAKWCACAAAITGSSETAR